MERSKALTAKVLIVIIVILVIAIVGLLAYIIFTNSKNNSTKNDTSNEGDPASIADVGNNITVNNDNQSNTNTTDPYVNYPNFAWVRTTSINCPTVALLSDETNQRDDMSVWIDSAGIVHVYYPSTIEGNDTIPSQEITLNSIPEKAKYITSTPSTQAVFTGFVYVLTENNNLYIFSPEHDIQKIASNIIELYRDEQYCDVVNNPLYEGRNIYWNLCIN